MVEIINQRVQQKLNERHKEIIIAFFKNKVKKHNDPTCRCNYCILLPEYARLKIYCHRLLKSLDNYYYFGKIKNLMDMENNLDHEINRRNLLKYEKDKLKKI